MATTACDEELDYAKRIFDQTGQFISVAGLTVTLPTASTVYLRILLDERAIPDFALDAVYKELDRRAAADLP